MRRLWMWMAFVATALAACGGDWRPMTVKGCFDPKGGHVQGMCTDGEYLYLTQMTGIYKVDRNGVCVKKIRTESHTGDVCCHGGRIYSSVAVYGGPDKGKGRIQVFDTDLNLVKEKTYPRGLDGIAWLDGVLYVGRGSHLDTAPQKGGGGPVSKNPHFENEVVRIDPETLEEKGLAVIGHGHMTRFGAQNIASDGTNLYFCFYGKPDLVVYDRDLKPVKLLNAGAGNGFEFVGTADGKPRFLKCRTLNWKAKPATELSAEISFAELRPFTAPAPSEAVEALFASGGTRGRLTWTGPATGWRLQTAGADGAFASGGAVQKLAAFMGEPAPSGEQAFRVEDQAGVRVCRAPDGTRVEISPDGSLSVFSASGKPVTEVRGVEAKGGRSVLSGRLLAAEPVFGLGQRLDRLNKRGQRVNLFTSDGYNNSDSTYLAVPFFTTHRGGGVFVNLYEGMVADFGATEPNVWRMEVDRDSIDAYLFAKDRIDDAIAAYTALSGRPDEPEDWNMGPVVCRYYPDLTRLEGPFACEFRGMRLRGHGLKDMMERHIALGAKPRAVIVEGGGFINLHADPGKRVELKRMAAYLAERDIKLMVYMRVGDLCSVQAPGYRDEFSVSVSVATNGAVAVADTKRIPDRYSHGINPDMGKARAHAEADITHPAFWDWYVGTIWKELVDLGVRGVKIDFCELLPEEGENPGGVSVHYKWHDPSVFAGTAVHHAYPTFFISRFYREMEKLAKGRGGFMVLSRGGGIGSQRNPFLWAGDQQRLFEKLDDQVLAMLNAGMSGVPFMTFDMAGYQYADMRAEPDGEIDGKPVVVRRTRRTDEKTEAAIFRRGTAFTAFSPCVQTHGFVRNAYDFDAATQAHYRKYMDVHASLSNYLARCNRAAAARGTPVVRPLAFRNPEDPRTWDVFDAFLLGDALLVAPALGPDDRAEAAFLPKGDWMRVPGLDVPVYLDRSAPGAELVPWQTWR